MLINFFHSLRDVGIPVTTRELLDLYEGLTRHVAFGSADEFYFFSRTCLVKDEKYFDRFDKAFGAHFEELQDLDDVIEAMIPDDWWASSAGGISSAPMTKPCLKNLCLKINPHN